MNAEYVMHRLTRWSIERRVELQVAWWALVVAMTLTTCEVAAVARDVVLYRVWAERGPTPITAATPASAATVANVGQRAGDGAGATR